MSAGERPWAWLAKRGLQGLVRAGRPAWAAWARPGYFSQPIDWGEPASVLLVSCDWLGDNLWARQVLPALRARWPGARFEVVTRPSAVALWPDADAVHPETAIVSDRARERVDVAALEAAARAHRRRGVELVIDLTGNRYSALFSFLVRPRRSLGFAGDELGALYACCVAADDPREHASVRPWRLVAPLLGALPAPIPAPSVPAPTRGLDLPEGRPLAVLGPAAGWAAKRWPAARYRGLAARLEGSGYQVVATGAPHEVELCREVLRGTAQGLLACWALPETLPLLQRAQVVVCNDSALGHLAAALGTRVIALFGPTNPARYAPLGPEVQVLRSACPDRPEGSAHHCHGRPRYPCPASCWDALTVDQVVTAVGAS